MLKLWIPHEEIKRPREWQEEKGTLPCLILEGGGGELYEEGGGFSPIV